MNDEVISEAEVVDYLRDHPDLLVAHPELLEVLEVPHAVDGTASLIEHQVAVLRDKSRRLNDKLRAYHDAAAENEALLRRVHDLYLEMIGADSVDALLAQVRGSLRKRFGCDFAAVAVFGPAPTAGVVGLDDEAAQVFARFRENGGSVCGRIGADRLAALFDDESAAAIESAALVPMGIEPFGLLALASRDADKFYPGMGTLFIDLLGQMLGESLRQRMGR